MSKKLSAAQVRFLEGCEEFEKGPTPRGLPASAADHRVHCGLIDRHLIAFGIAAREYVLTPQGRTALTEHRARAHK